MIELHQYPPAFGLSSLSPFCIKIETYLKLMKIPYRSASENNPLRGPRGRMPFLIEGESVISDSHLILDALEAQAASPMDAFLSQRERGVAFAIRRLLDQDLIRVILYSRWVDERGWKVLKKEFLPYFPFGFRRMALGAIRFALKKEAVDCGILEFSENEIYALGSQQLKALSHLLGAQSFFFGEQISTADVTAYAFLVLILRTPIDVPLRRTLLVETRLIEFVERVETHLI